jgi:hypothetical protein
MVLGSGFSLAAICRAFAAASSQSPGNIDFCPGLADYADKNGRDGRLPP